MAAGAYCMPGKTSVRRLCSRGMSSATSFGTTVSMTDWMSISCSGSLTATTNQITRNIQYNQSNYTKQILLPIKLRVIQTGEIRINKHKNYTV